MLDHEKLLIIGMTKHQPINDRKVIKNIVNNIDTYKQRLCKASGEKPAVYTDNGLYTPLISHLWGPFDFATLYLGDDFDSIPQISNGTGVISQEYLVGSPYKISGRNVTDLFDPNHLKKKAFISITKLKLADQFLCLGTNEFRDAVATKISQSINSGTTCVILRCWSWPDLIVVTLDDDPATIEKNKAIFGSLTLKKVYGNDLQKTVSKWIELIPGREILKRWTGIDKGNNILNHLDKLGSCDTVVAIKSQAGLHQTGWKETSNTYLSDPSTENIKIALSFLMEGKGYTLHESKIRRNPSQYIKSMTGSIEKFLSDFFNKQDQQSKQPKKFAAHINIEVKPGHSATIISFLNYIINSQKGNFSLYKTSNGEGQVVTLVIKNLPLNKQGLFALYIISNALRVCSGSSHNIYSIETAFFVDIDNSLGPKKKAPGSEELHGHRLLSTTFTPNQKKFEKKRIQSKGITKVEGTSLAYWFSAIQLAATRPEIFASFSYLVNIAKDVYIDLVYNTDEGDYPLIVDGAVALGKYFQIAYQQHLQYSPVLSGAPPIDGQLPYGINQILLTLDGVCASIIEAGIEQDTGTDSNERVTRNILTVFDATPVIANKSILNYNIFNVNLNQATTPLVLPLLFHELGHLIQRNWLVSLKSNYSELKPKSLDDSENTHLLNLLTCWQLDSNETQKEKKSYRHLGLDLKIWRDLLDSIASILGEYIQNEIALLYKSGKPRDDIANYAYEKGTPIIFLEEHSFRDKWEERISNFIEDLFAHSAWRTIGCSSNRPIEHGTDQDFKIFETQFLLGLASGFRFNISPADPYPSFIVMGEAIAHLFYQRCRHRNPHIFKPPSIHSDFKTGFKIFLLYCKNGFYDVSSFQHLDNYQNLKTLYSDLFNTLDVVYKYCAGEMTRCYAVLKNKGPSFFQNPLESEATIKKHLAQHALPWLYVLQNIFCSSNKFAQLTNKPSNTTEYVEAFKIHTFFSKATKSMNYRIAKNYANLQNKLTKRINSGHNISEISKTIREGNTPEIPPATLLKNDFYPSLISLGYIREVLKGVTQTFIDKNNERRAKGLFSLSRDKDFSLIGPSDRGITRGIFTDPLLAIVAMGKDERAEYLKIKTAAMETLSRISLGLLASPILFKLRHRRGYHRQILNSPKKSIMTVDNKELYINIINISPAGVYFDIPQLDDGPATNNLTDKDMEKLNNQLTDLNSVYRKLLADKFEGIPTQYFEIKDLHGSLLKLLPTEVNSQQGGIAVHACLVEPFHDPEPKLDTFWCWT